MDFTEAGNGWEVLFAALFSGLSTLIAVWVALLLQRRDFDRRTAEAIDAELRRAGTAASETRRDLVATAIRALAVAEAAALDPYGHIQHVQPEAVTTAQIEETAALLTTDPDLDSVAVGNWFRKYALELRASSPGVEGRQAWVAQRAETMRSELLAWNRRERASADFRIL
ncbi:hypothetical protein ACWKWP_04545 [Agromyces soli]